MGIAASAPALTLTPIPAARIRRILVGLPASIRALRAPMTTTSTLRTTNTRTRTTTTCPKAVRTPSALMKLVETGTVTGTTISTNAVGETVSVGNGGQNIVKYPK